MWILDRGGACDLKIARTCGAFTTANLPSAGALVVFVISSGATSVSNELPKTCQDCNFSKILSVTASHGNDTAQWHERSGKSGVFQRSVVAGVPPLPGSFRPPPRIPRAQSLPWGLHGCEKLCCLHGSMIHYFTWGAPVRQAPFQMLLRTTCRQLCKKRWMMICDTYKTAISNTQRRHVLNTEHLMVT